MVSEIVKESMNDAKEALDSAEKTGELGYNLCDGILSNIKVHIHNKEIMDEVMKKETQVYEIYKQKYSEAKNKLKEADPMYAWRKGMEYYMKLRQWKSTEMYNFMDQVTKKHDL